MNLFQSPENKSTPLDVEKVQEAIEKIRPYLQADGGDLELFEIKDYTVYVRVYGACVSCHALDLTITYGVESLLREEVDPKIQVKQVL